MANRSCGSRSATGARRRTTYAARPPRSVSARATALAAPLRAEYEDLGLVRRSAEAFTDREAGNPDDLTPALHHGDAVPLFARNLVVGEQVLQRLRAVEARRLHAV